MSNIIKLLDKNLIEIHELSNDEIIELIVDKELSGNDSIRLRMPIDANGADKIKEGTYIRLENQNYTVETINPERNSENLTILSVEAAHVFFENEQKLMPDEQGFRNNVLEHLNHVLGNTDFNIIARNMNSPYYNIDRHISYRKGETRLEAIKRIINVFKGDFILDGFNFVVIPPADVEDATGVVLEYSINNESVSATKDDTNVITTIYAVGGEVTIIDDEVSEEIISYIAKAPDFIKDKYRKSRKSFLNLSDVLVLDNLKWIVDKQLEDKMYPRVSYRLSVAELKRISNIDEIFPNRSFEMNIGDIITINDPDIGTIHKPIQRYRYYPLEPERSSELSIGDKPFDIFFSEERKDDDLGHWRYNEVTGEWELVRPIIPPEDDPRGKDYTLYIGREGDGSKLEYRYKTEVEDAEEITISVKYLAINDGDLVLTIDGIDYTIPIEAGDSRSTIAHKIANVHYTGFVTDIDRWKVILTAGIRVAEETLTTTDSYTYSFSNSPIKPGSINVSGTNDRYDTDYTEGTITFKTNQSQNTINATYDYLILGPKDETATYETGDTGIELDIRTAKGTLTDEFTPWIEAGYTFSERFYQNTVVEVTPLEDVGQTFIEWVGDGEGSPTRTFNMDYHKDAKIIYAGAAVPSADEHNLYVNKDGGGTDLRYRFKTTYSSHEEVMLGVRSSATKSFTLALNLGGTNYDIFIERGMSRNQIAAMLAGKTYSGWSTEREGPNVKFIADAVGSHPQSSIDTGASENDNHINITLTINKGTIEDTFTEWSIEGYPLNGNFSSGTIVEVEPLEQKGEKFTEWLGQGSGTFTRIFTITEEAQDALAVYEDIEDAWGRDHTLYISKAGGEGALKYRFTPSGDSPESMRITIENIAETSGDVTVTLKGTSYTISVEAGDSMAQVAEKIADQTYAGWVVERSDWTVTFEAEDDGYSTLSTNYSPGDTGATARVQVVKGTTEGVRTEWMPESYPFRGRFAYDDVVQVYPIETIPAWYPFEKWLGQGSGTPIRTFVIKDTKDAVAVYEDIDDEQKEVKDYRLNIGTTNGNVVEHRHKSIYEKAETVSITIQEIPEQSGDITLNLGGTEYTISVTENESRNSVAQKIADQVYAGWVVTRNITTVRFIAGEEIIDETPETEDGYLYRLSEWPVQTGSLEIDGTEDSYTFYEESGIILFSDYQGDNTITADYTVLHVGSKETSSYDEGETGAEASISISKGSEYNVYTHWLKQGYPINNSYYEGDIVQVRPIVKENEEFSHWVGDGSGDSLRTFVMDDHKDADAIYEEPVKIDGLSLYISREGGEGSLEYSYTANEDKEEEIRISIDKGATSSGNIKINLSGTDYIISVAEGDSRNVIAQMIHDNSFTGWTTDRNAWTVTFTADAVGSQPEVSTFDGQDTGVEASVAITKGTSAGIPTAWTPASLPFNMRFAYNDEVKLKPVEVENDDGFLHTFLTWTGQGSGEFVRKFIMQDDKDAVVYFEDEPGRRVRETDYSLNIRSEHGTICRYQFATDQNLPEVVTLSITKMAMVSDDIIITLDGSSTTIPIVGGDSRNIMAQKIADATYTGWTASRSGTNVTFTAETDGSKAGNHEFDPKGTLSEGNIRIEKGTIAEEFTHWKQTSFTFNMRFADGDIVRVEPLEEEGENFVEWAGQGSGTRIREFIIDDNKDAVAIYDEKARLDGIALHISREGGEGTLEYRFKSNVAREETVRLSITKMAESSGDISFTIGGLSYSVYVNTGESRHEIAEKIGNLHYSGWEVDTGGTDTITFVAKLKGFQGVSIFNPSNTGVEANISSTPGSDGETMTGWIPSGYPLNKRFNYGDIVEIKPLDGQEVDEDTLETKVTGTFNRWAGQGSGSFIRKFIMTSGADAVAHYDAPEADPARGRHPLSIIRSGCGLGHINYRVTSSVNAYEEVVLNVTKPPTFEGTYSGAFTLDGQSYPVSTSFGDSRSDIAASIAAGSYDGWIVEYEDGWSVKFIATSYGAKRYSPTFQLNPDSDTLGTFSISMSANKGSIDGTDSTWVIADLPFNQSFRDYDIVTVKAVPDDEFSIFREWIGDASGSGTATFNMVGIYNYPVDEDDEEKFPSVHYDAIAYFDITDEQVVIDNVTQERIPIEDPEEGDPEYDTDNLILKGEIVQFGKYDSVNCGFIWSSDSETDIEFPALWDAWDDDIDDVDKRAKDLRGGTVREDDEEKIFEATFRRDTDLPAGSVYYVRAYATVRDQECDVDRYYFSEPFEVNFYTTDLTNTLAIMQWTRFGGQVEGITLLPYHGLQFFYHGTQVEIRAIEKIGSMFKFVGWAINQEPGVDTYSYSNEVMKTENGYVYTVENTPIKVDEEGVIQLVVSGTSDPYTVNTSAGEVIFNTSQIGKELTASYITSLSLTTANPTTVTMDENIVATAVFEYMPFDLNIREGRTRRITQEERDRGAPDIKNRVNVNGTTFDLPVNVADLVKDGKVPIKESFSITAVPDRRNNFAEWEVIRPDLDQDHPRRNQTTSNRGITLPYDRSFNLIMHTEHEDEGYNARRLANLMKDYALRIIGNPGDISPKVARTSLSASIRYLGQIAGNYRHNRLTEKPHQQTGRRKWSIQMWEGDVLTYNKTGWHPKSEEYTPSEPTGDHFEFQSAVNVTVADLGKIDRRIQSLRIDDKFVDSVIMNWVNRSISPRKFSTLNPIYRNLTGKTGSIIRANAYDIDSILSSMNVTKEEEPIMRRFLRKFHGTVGTPEDAYVEINANTLISGVNNLVREATNTQGDPTTARDELIDRATNDLLLIPGSEGVPDKIITEEKRIQYGERLTQVSLSDAQPWTYYGKTPPPSDEDGKVGDIWCEYDEDSGLPSGE